ncbi:WXG100 family type VII secretion target [Streptomyces sp. TRM68367]|uniref:WXG100 family type VII secretion target n=1 Tax=Streptomyces sp. TRM68367 TaxID=2758415 RepID=UPI00165C252A|nr:WXG100 family type VII secretion target [Streptomyces sp. TRM68367]MBC9730528.1 WXG100 family type VII secretion target [Streptomyces sp. TRM68367]
MASIPVGVAPAPASGSRTQVDLPGLQKAINQFSTGVQNFDQSYKYMTRTASEITSAWTGAASTSFEQAMNNWLNDFYKVIRVLNGMENALSQNTSVLNQTNETTIAHAQRAAAGITAPRLPNF